MRGSFFRRFAAVAFFGLFAAGGACGGEKFTALPNDGGGAEAGGDDASADGATDATDTGFCATQTMRHFLCDDFDRRANDLKGLIWDDLTVSGDSDQMLIDSTEALSPPRSLLVETTRPNIVFSEQDMILLKKCGHARSLDIAYDLKLESYGGNGTNFDTNGALLTEIGFGPLSYVLILESPTQVVFLESIAPDGGQKMSSTIGINAGPMTGQWVHVDIKLTLPQAGQQGEVVIAIGGQIVLMHGLQYNAFVPLTEPAVVGLGLILGSAPNVWKLRYDNVTIDRTT